MASGILSLQPFLTALCLKPTSIQRKTGKYASELNPEARHENTWRNGGLVPRILNLALDRSEWSASHSRTLHSVSTGGGAQPIWTFWKEKSHVHDRTMSPRTSSLQPIPHTDSVKLLMAQYNNDGSKTTFRVASRQQALRQCVSLCWGRRRQLTQSGKWTQSLSSLPALQTPSTSVPFRQTLLSVCLTISFHLCYRCYTIQFLLQLW